VIEGRKGKKKREEEVCRGREKRGRKGE